jgi:hypothetical protein
MLSLLDQRHRLAKADPAFRSSAVSLRMWEQVRLSHEHHRLNASRIRISRIEDHDQSIRLVHRLVFPDHPFNGTFLALAYSGTEVFRIRTSYRKAIGDTNLRLDYCDSRH